MTDMIWTIIDPVFDALGRAFELAISPEIAPFSAGAVLLLVVIVTRMRKTSIAARG